MENSQPLCSAFEQHEICILLCARCFHTFEEHKSQKPVLAAPGTNKVPKEAHHDLVGKCLVDLRTLSHNLCANPHKLSDEEEKLWKRLKKEENTKEDWIDLNDCLVAYKRRFIARHVS